SQCRCMYLVSPACSKSLQFDDVKASRIELYTIQAILRARLARVGACNVERRGVAAAAESAIGGIAGSREVSERLTSGIKNVDPRFIARSGGSIDIAGRIERHAVDAASAAEV